MTVDDLKSFIKTKGIILPPLQSSKYFTSILSELKEDEELMFFCQAKEEKVDGTFFVSSKRVGFIKIGFFSGTSTVSMNIDKINSVSKKKGFVSGEIEIWDNSGKITYSLTSLYLDEIENCINQAKAKFSNLTTSSVSISTADEILKFKSLLDNGIITQEEFEKKKKELLNL